MTEWPSQQTHPGRVRLSVENMQELPSPLFRRRRGSRRRHRRRFSVAYLSSDLSRAEFFLTFHLDHASKRLEATAICRGTNLDEPHAQLKPRVAEETHKVETGPTIVEVIKELFSYACGVSILLLIVAGETIVSELH